MRVFIDDKGMFYKANEPAADSHAERSLVSADMLAVLSDDGTPMAMVDIDEKVRQYISNPKPVVAEGEKNGGEVAE